VSEGYHRGAQRRERTDRRTIERVEALERRLEERRAEGFGEVM
jgi:DNA-binding IclR family transcriptional regulator